MHKWNTISDQREGIINLRIYQYWIEWFNPIYFVMLKSAEHEKSWCYSDYDSPNSKDYSEVRSCDPQI